MTKLSVKLNPMGNPYIIKEGHKFRHITVNISEYVMQHALKIKYSILCNSLHPPATSLVSGPAIILSTLFSITLTYVLPSG
jgi:hypothetical protein